MWAGTPREIQDTIDLNAVAGDVYDCHSGGMSGVPRWIANHDVRHRFANSAGTQAEKKQTAENTFHR
jgi:hypothetical protein